MGAEQVQEGSQLPGVRGASCHSVGGEEGTGHSAGTWSPQRRTMKSCSGVRDGSLHFNKLPSVHLNSRLAELLEPGRDPVSCGISRASSPCSPSKTTDASIRGCAWPQGPSPPRHFPRPVRSRTPRWSPGPVCSDRHTAPTTAYFQFGTSLVDRCPGAAVIKPAASGPKPQELRSHQKFSVPGASRAALPGEPP